MKRRELLAGLLPVAVAPPARAQQPGKMHRIAIFHPTNPVSDISEQGTLGYRLLFKELRRLGYEEGRSLTVDRYSGGGQGLQSHRQLASQIVATRPDLIFPSGDIFIPAFVEAAAGKVPIFVTTGDPIEMGLTTSLARPSGNVTGIVADTGGWAISHKRFEVIRELRPGLKHVAVLHADYIWKSARIQTFNRGLEEQWGIRITCLCVATPVGEAAYRQAFADVERERPDVIWVANSSENFTYTELILGLVNAVRIPAVYPNRSFVERGGLISFGADFDEAYGHLAHQMDMILRGRPVAEVPFFRLTKAELAINLRTAEMLGIEIPPLLLARADKMIE